MCNVEIVGWCEYMIVFISLIWSVVWNFLGKFVVVVVVMVECLYVCYVLGGDDVVIVVGIWGM